MSTLDKEFLEFTQRARGLEGMDPEEAVNVLHHYAQQGPSWVVRGRDGKIELAGGGVELRKGVVWVWILSTDKIKDYRFSMVKAIKQGLEELRELYSPHRIEAECLKDNETYNSFLSYLGFKVESLMKHYGPNKEDYVRYVILDTENNA